MLNLDFQFILTEIITPISIDIVKKEFNTQTSLLQINNDDDFPKTSGFSTVAELIKNNEGKEFCYQNIMITLLADKIDDLNIAIEKVYKLI